MVRLIERGGVVVSGSWGMVHGASVGGDSGESEVAELGWWAVVGWCVVSGGRERNGLLVSDLSGCGGGWMMWHWYSTPPCPHVAPPGWCAAG